MNPEMLEKGMSPEQVKTIQDHLNLVFNKVTPDRFENLIVDYSLSGNPTTEHPGSTSGQYIVNLDGSTNKKKSLMQLRREEGSSPSTGGKRVYC